MTMSITKNSIDLGIVTTQGDAMLAFYRDTLGLRYVREMPMPGGAGVMHQMLCGESMIKLVVLPETPAQAAPGGIPGATGYRYWTITVSNMAEVLEECKAAGTKIIFGEKSIAPKVRIAMLADPDGNWVELLSIG